MTMSQNKPLNEKPLILYDGVCNFCNAIVRLVLEKDDKEKFSFAPIQSKEARAALRRHNEQFASLKTIYFIEAGRTYKRSAAVFRIFAKLPFPWRVLSLFRFLPQGFTDIFYRLIARYRYTLFGKSMEVQQPFEKEKHRFLNYRNNG